MTSLENNVYALKFVQETHGYGYVRVQVRLSYAFILARTFLFYALIKSGGSTADTVSWDVWGT